MSPERQTNHPLGCHRTRIPDRVIFEKLLQVRMFGCACWWISDKRCSTTTLRRRRDERIELGAMDALEGLVRQAYYPMVGLDIDIVIRRTLVYGILTASLALVYFGDLAVAQGVLHAFTGQEQQPQLAVGVSTLVIAALFNPLRGRIKSYIDKRFYRSKYDARKTLEAFSATLNQETDLDVLSDDLVTVVRGTMQPTRVSLWLRPETDANGEQIVNR